MSLHSFRLRVQRYDIFFVPPNFFAIFSAKSLFLSFSLDSECLSDVEKVEETGHHKDFPDFVIDIANSNFSSFSSRFLAECEKET